MDDVIRSFLPPSRRKNHYCKPCESVYNAVHSATSLHDLMNIYESTDPTLLDPTSIIKYKDPTRYRGINLISLWKEWHAEIRYHNSTLQGERILHWAYLHCLIMDKIMDGTITLAWIESMRATKGLSVKSKALYAILGMNKPTEIYLKARQIKFSTIISKLLSTEVIENLQLLQDNSN